mmetsp:Transcript_6110/g.23077  ORF Transcript_6110/g.23077 Transcript_6110/m.23077 type:complete len:234 (+) Transcript_6110:3990-4691(+)
MFANARCTSVAGFTAITTSPTAAASEETPLPFLPNEPTPPCGCFRHCTTNGAGLRFRVCSKTAACSGSSLHSIFFSFSSSAFRTHSRFGGTGAHRGHATSQSAAHCFLSPATSGTNFWTPSGRSKRLVNQFSLPNVALLRSFRRVTKSPSGQSFASTAGSGTVTCITATALAHPPTPTQSAFAFRGAARTAFSLLRSSNFTAPTFIHCPSVPQVYTILALVSLARKSGETRPP